MPDPASPLTALNRAVKADPEGAPVYEVEMTADEARAAVEDVSNLEGHALTDLFDEAQAPVFSGEKEAAFIVIRIRS